MPLGPWWAHARRTLRPLAALLHFGSGHSVYSEKVMLIVAARTLQRSYALRFTVYDDADSPLEHFATYGEATAGARMRSVQADRPEAVYTVRDHEYGLTLNGFCSGETIKERVHKNAFLAVTVARSADQLERVVAEYVDELGLPELGGIAYDEAVTRAADSPSIARVFQAAAEQSDKIESP